MLIKKCDINNFKHKVLISGSRQYKDYNQFKSLIEEFISRYNLERDNTVFISGKASNGADLFIINYCESNSYNWVEFPAEWENLTKEPVKIKINKAGKEYNALAGFNRNKNMVDICNLAAFFWDGISPGTKDAISQIKQKTVPHVVYLINGERNVI